MKKLLLLSVILGAMGCGVQKLEKEVAKQTPLAIPANTDVRPIMLKKVIIKLDRGTEIGRIYGGCFCADAGPFTWEGGSKEVEEFNSIVREEFEKASYPIVGNPDALFEDPAEWKAELVIAGLVNQMKLNLCLPYVGFGDYKTCKGNAYIKVNWQIYSRLDRRVIYEVTTEGTFSAEIDMKDGYSQIPQTAFANATQNLLADTGFYQLVTKTEPHKPQDPNQKELVLNGPQDFQDAIIQSIKQIHDSSATVFAGDGHGSGFFITEDGYFITNEHVVREAEKVTLKLTKGENVIGNVIRTNTKRDVALIKVPEGTFSPLPIRQTALSMSEEVYTLGTPINEKFEGTLSKGIVSGFREENKMPFIQSDVNVLPGSSGGPLLDAKGNVVGITASAFFIGQAPAGINYFIPIQDAIEALQIKYSAK